MTEVLVVCGAGGVGKTTCAAALAVRHAKAGRKVALVTIDPARRLADALGLAGLGNDPTPVTLPDGTTLDALMLDRKATWDALVAAHARDAETAARLLANPYYQAISTRLGGGHEYMATEKLHALATDGRWDLVVVDTPPSLHAVDFFRAPDRIRRVLDQRWLAALLRPGDGLVGLATRRVTDVVRRLAGEGVLADLAAFFDLAGGVAERLRAHGAEVDALLRGAACRYLLVTSARAPREEEVRALAALLAADGRRVHALLLNRAAAPLTHPEAALIGALPDAPAGVDGMAWDRVRAALTAAVHEAAARARADAATAERLGALAHAPVWPVPELEAGIATQDALTGLADALPLA